VPPGPTRRPRSSASQTRWSARTSTCAAADGVALGFSCFAGVEAGGCDE
jgi:hypothetical protein